MKFHQLMITILILTSLFSCKEKINSKKRISYRRELVKLQFPDNNKEFEVYISELGDTIHNQIKIYSNDKLDSLESFFYVFKTEPSETENVYNGKIKFHSPIDFEKVQNRDLRLVFSFKEESLDSIFLTTVRQNKSKEIEFKYTNVKNDNLFGVLIKYTYQDTIIDNEEMVNIIEEKILIDNNIKTENVFIQPYEFNKNNIFTTKGFKNIND
tara:strand:- start:180 stop:815 length:636 start_codon:yes stop_codon:yes gene_type:complete